MNTENIIKALILAGLIESETEVDKSRLADFENTLESVTAGGR